MLCRAMRPLTAGVLLLLLVAGCGPSIGHVKGKVTFRDRPLSSGTVTFVSAGGQTRSAAIAEDGAYRIADVPAGTVKIAVISHPRVPAGLMGNSPVALRAAAKPLAIPARYRSPEQSGLTFLVQSGEQDHDIDLRP